MLNGTSLFRFHDSWGDVPPRQRVPAGSLRKTMFPDGEAQAGAEKDGETEEKEKEALLRAQLLRCARLRVAGHATDPTDDDSVTHDLPAYLFLACFRRASSSCDLSEEAGGAPRAWATAEAPVKAAPDPSREPRFSRAYRDLPRSDPLWRALEARWGLDVHLPRDLELVVERDVRSPGSERAVRCVSAGAARLLRSCARDETRLQLISAGLALFKPLASSFVQHVALRWRPTQAGAAFVGARATRCVHRVSARAMRALLAVGDDKTADANAVISAVDVPRLVEIDAGLAEACAATEPGALLLGVKRGDGGCAALWVVAIWTGLALHPLAGEAVRSAALSLTS